MREGFLGEILGCSGHLIVDEGEHIRSCSHPVVGHGHDVEIPAGAEPDDRMAIRPDMPAGTRQLPDQHDAQVQGSVCMERAQAVFIRRGFGTVEGKQRAGRAVQVDAASGGPRAQKGQLASKSGTLSASALEPPNTATPRATPCLGPGSHRRHRRGIWRFSRRESSRSSLMTTP